MIASGDPESVRMRTERDIRLNGGGMAAGGPVVRIPGDTEPPVGNGP